MFLLKRRPTPFVKVGCRPVARARGVLTGLALLLFASAGAADYRFDVGGDSAQVTLTIDQPATVFRMPAWLPGDYQLFHYGKAVTSATFLKGGAVVDSEKTDVDTWRIPDGATTVKYKIAPSAGNFGPNLRVKDREVFINGGGVFGSFDGHRHEPTTLRTASPAYCCLKRESSVWMAADYDELLDSPIVIGPDVKSATKEVHGKAHTVYAFGKNQDADVVGFLDVGAKAAEQAFRVFGELPYDRYALFLDFGGQGGGLEHRSGARIGFPASTRPHDAFGLTFHEYFHCFNVKRIRPQVLGPFDYTKPAVTSTLWWLEGVTDYYAAKLATRAGLTTRAEFLSDLAKSAGEVSSGPYLRLPVSEASTRVWESAGSWGYGGVDYYTKGRAIGLFLDLAILGQTHGRKSLDDVVRQLYLECKPPKPGYSEGRIRGICVAVGGDRIGELYDRAVESVQPLPWRDVLEGVGMTLEGGTLKETGERQGLEDPLTNWP